MSERLWWERWPEVRDREIAALDSASIAWKLDDVAVSKGIYRLRVELPPDLGGHRLSIVYPDAYPYFRCQVYAEHLALPHHQNPFERNLCLLGRRTHYWDVDDTAARLIIEQFPIVLKAGSTEDRQEVIGIEEQQAEPFSDYYRYAFSMILVQSDWQVPKNCSSGYMVIGIPSSSEELPSCFIRGAVLRLLTEKGEIIFEADDSIKAVYCGRKFDARWGRFSEAIKEDSPVNFINAIIQLRPELGDSNANHVNNGWLRIWGVLFPEEVEHRGIGEGWVFACAVDKKRPSTAHKPHFEFKPEMGRQKR